MKPAVPPSPSDPSQDAAPTRAQIAERLLGWPEDALYREIGLRAEMLRLDRAQAFSWPSRPTEEGQGSVPGLERLGGRLVDRLGRQIEDLIAGEEAIDALDRHRLLGASALAGAAPAVEIASALIAGFAIAPAIAPLAAAALCRRGAPARWPDLADARDREALSAIRRLTEPDG